MGFDLEVVVLPNLDLGTYRSAIDTAEDRDVIRAALASRLVHDSEGGAVFPKSVTDLIYEWEELDKAVQAADLSSASVVRGLLRDVAEKVTTQEPYAWGRGQGPWWKLGAEPCEHPPVLVFGGITQGDPPFHGFEGYAALAHLLHTTLRWTAGT